MARRVISNAAGAVAPAYVKEGTLLGVIEQDPVPPALARPTVVPGPVLPDGNLPVTIAYPPNATSVTLWCTATRIFRPMVNGLNYLRQGDLGYDITTDSIVALFEARGPGGATSNWIPRTLLWAEGIELPPVDVPVTLTSGGTMTTSGQVGGAITLSPNAIWAGSVRQTDSWLETSPNGSAPWTNVGDIATIPNSVGTYLRATWAAYGPGVSGNNEWHYTHSAAVQIIAATVAAIDPDDVTFGASFFRPNTQSVNFAPLFTVDGGYSDMQFSTEEPPVNWYAVIAASGSLTTTNNTAGNFTSEGAAKRGRFRLRHRPNSGVPYSDPSPQLTVPVAADPSAALYALMRPSNAAIESSLQSNLVPYAVQRPVGVGGGNAGINDRKWDPLVWVMASLAGVNTTFANGRGRNPRAFAIAQFQSWCSDAGDTAPACRSGYHGQHEMRVAAFFALCLLDPNIWNAAGITDTMRNRARWLMKSLLLPNAFIASSRVRGLYYGGGFGSTTGQRNFQGWTAGNNNVANFSSPPRLTPHVVAAFMARDTGNPTAAADFLASYDRATHYAEGEALGGMNEARLTFRYEWTTALQKTHYGTASTMGAGPTDAIIKDILNHTPFQMVGEGGPFTLAQPRQAMAGELTRVFSEIVRPGPLNVIYGGKNMGANTVGAPYNTTASKYGILGTAQTANELRACIGVPTVEANPVGGARGSGATIYEDAWLGLPDKGLVGMYQEFNTTDGAVSGGGPGPFVRSAPTYGISGLGAIMDALVVLIMYGIIEPDDALFATAKARWRIGIRNFNYVAKKGYRGYAKGGIPSDNNVDWTPAYVNRNYSWPAFMGMMDRVAVFWGFNVFPNDP